MFAIHATPSCLLDKLALGRSDTVGVLPQMPVLGTLPLGLPTTRATLGLHRVDASMLELNVSTGDVVAGHDIGRVLVPFRTEDVEADRFEGWELVLE